MDRNIPSDVAVVPAEQVALRKESVDRNTGCKAQNLRDFLVALRKESVDRNRDNTGVNLALGGRSPQGERG